MAAPHLLVENNPDPAADHITFPITHSRAFGGHNYFMPWNPGFCGAFPHD
jgi:hypothetical protein